MVEKKAWGAEISSSVQPWVTALIWDWGQETDLSELFYALQWNASIVIDALFINVIDFKEHRASKTKPLTASKAIIAILKTAETELML